MKHVVPVLQAILTIPLVLCLASPVLAEETGDWHGTLYRNGGHFGDTNSDERLEFGYLDAVPPCSDFAPLTFDDLVSADDAWEFDDATLSRRQNLGQLLLPRLKP